MQNVQKASAGMNLYQVLSVMIRRRPNNHQHLNQEALKATLRCRPMIRRDGTNGHDGSNVGEDVSDRGIDDEPVDRLAEDRKGPEGDEDYERAHKGD